MANVPKLKTEDTKQLSHEPDHSSRRPKSNRSSHFVYDGFNFTDYDKGAFEEKEPMSDLDIEEFDDPEYDWALEEIDTDYDFDILDELDFPKDNKT